MDQAADLMARFARRTGLDGVSGRPQARYLWTDAFAVCNYLGLAQRDPQALDRALALIDAVHATLGQHRSDDVRRGPLSGLPEREAAEHPTAGGLRIGKPLPERAPGTPPDPQLEWDRDGQYFHYLTRWMHALNQAGLATGQAHYNRWARELAAVACRTFARPGPGGGLYWKMSIDLTRPLVAASGQHDAVDGFVTCLCLEAGARRLDPAATGPSLAGELEQLGRWVENGVPATDDPLGLGGLLVEAYRVAQLQLDGGRVPPTLLSALLSAAGRGLARLDTAALTRAPASRRLAFRELGLAIGLTAAQRLAARVAARQPLDGASGGAGLNAVLTHGELARTLVAFWRTPEHQAGASWSEHLDINAVMLATALDPDGYLEPGAGRLLSAGP